MKRFFKKTVSLFLVAVFVFGLVQSFSVVNAGNLPLNQDFEILHEELTEHAYVQISESNGFVYYFVDTAYYTISAVICLDTGLATAYRKDKITGTMQRGNALAFEQSLFRAFGELDVLSDINNLGEKLRNNTEVFDIEIDVSAYIQTTYFYDMNSLFTSFSALNPNVARELRFHGHNERNLGRTGHWAQEGNIRAELLESTRFSLVNMRAFRIVAGTTVVTIGALIALPASVVAAVWLVVVGYGGVLVSAITGDINQYTVNVRYARIGEITGFNTGGMYAAGRDIRRVVTVGDGGRTTSSVQWDNWDWRFHDRDAILRESIRLFRNISGM